MICKGVYSKIYDRGLQVPLENFIKDFTSCKPSVLNTDCFNDTFCAELTVR